MNIEKIPRFIKKICLLLSLGKPITLFKVTSSKDIFQLKTEKGNFAVKRLSKKNFENPRQGERIAIAFAGYGFPAITALSDGKKILVSFGHQEYVVYPWCEGYVLESNYITLKQAYKVGQLLGQMHEINLQLPDIKGASWHDFIAPDWEALIKQSDLAKQLQNTIDKLNIWTQQYHEANAQLKQTYVISHGDLTPANIVWKTASDPWIIDWESAGWIHPHLELLGVALNWANIGSASINLNNFQAVINGYQSLLGKIEIHQTIAAASLGSWLKWIVFNIKDTQLDKKSRLIEIERTISAINQIDNFF